MHLDPDIHNYYEHLVSDYINATPSYSDYDTDFIADICCLALSMLPARYIRHDIDMAFYLNSAQRLEMSKEVQIAVAQSLEHLLKKKQSQAESTTVK